LRSTSEATTTVEETVTGSTIDNCKEDVSVLSEPLIIAKLEEKINHPIVPLIKEGSTVCSVDKWPDYVENRHDSESYLSMEEPRNDEREEEKNRINITDSFSEKSLRVRSDAELAPKNDFKFTQESSFEKLPLSIKKKLRQPYRIRETSSKAVDMIRSFTFQGSSKINKDAENICVQDMLVSGTCEDAFHASKSRELSKDKNLFRRENCSQLYLKLKEAGFSYKSNKLVTAVSQSVNNLSNGKPKNIVVEELLTDCITMKSSVFGPDQFSSRKLKLSAHQLADVAIDSADYILKNNGNVNQAKTAVYNILLFECRKKYEDIYGKKKRRAIAKAVATSALSTKNLLFGEF